MKRILITLIVLAARVSAESIMDPAAIDQKIEKTLFASDEMLSMNLGQVSDHDVSWITDENRPLVVRKLRERYQQTGMDDPEYLGEALVMAGDWDATLEMIGNIKDPHKDTRSLTFSGEKIIPYLIPLICNKSEAGPNAMKPDDDEKQKQVRHKALQYFMLIMSDSKVFPPETAEWAGNGFVSENLLTEEESAAFISTWWEHNKDAILEKRYADASWLPERPTPEDYAKKRWQKMEREILGYLRQSKAGRSGPADASEAASGKESAGSGGGALQLRLAFMSIGAVMVAAGHFLWRRFVAKAA